MRFSCSRNQQLCPKAPTVAFLVSAFVLVFFAMPERANGDTDARNGAFSIEIVKDKGSVLKAVQEVVDDKVVHGTWVYEKNKTLEGAHPAETSSVWRGERAAGKTFYKVADGVIAPRYFKDSADIGTITVRYVVESIDRSTTRLSIQAVFVESGRREVHHSTGTVETAEYAAIQEHLRKFEAAAEEAELQKAEVKRNAALEAEKRTPATTTSALPHTADDSKTALSQLRQHVDDLRHKVGMRVVTGGASLKSAPFQSAKTLALVAGATDVLIVAVTPHWYGVETQDGHRGWVHSKRLEPLP